MDVSPNAIAKALRLRKRFRGIECGGLSAFDPGLWQISAVAVVRPMPSQAITRSRRFGRSTLKLLHSTCRRSFRIATGQLQCATTGCRLHDTGASFMLEPDAGPTRMSGS